ncbi:MAG: beta-N-acetylhexosaminidase [Phycisphaerae bacterium]|nr:beta-N-acetylhexosaminidase [Phycisphaerae bacterium]
MTKQATQPIGLRRRPGSVIRSRLSTPFRLWLMVSVWLPVLLVCAPTRGADSRDEVLSRLVPRPREIHVADGRLEWRKRIAVVVTPDRADDRFAAQTLIDACRERKLNEPRIVPTQEVVDLQADVVVFLGDPCRLWPLARILRTERVAVPPEVGDEGYLLEVTPDRVFIAGNAPAGVYYGVQTLIQLLPEAEPAAIPAVRICDWTEIRYRGCSVDLFCGKVGRTEWMRENIRRLAHYKMNSVVFYLEDAFLFPSHPDIGEDRDRLTTPEVLELDAFARKHHVEVIPCYNSPGHMLRTLAHPRYAHLAEGTDNEAQRAVINVTHPDAYPLLTDLYTDLCKAFPSRLHYMAGDEALALGTGRSKGAASEIGAAQLFVRHIKNIREVLAAHGKRMVVAGDPFEPDFFKAFGLANYGLDALAQVPRDVIIVPWHYGKLEQFPFGQQLVDMGFDQIIWTSNAAFGELFPNVDGAAENIESVLPWVHKLGAMGTAHSEWNGYGENIFSEYNWPAIAFAAEWGWTSHGRPWNEALPMIVESFYGPGTSDLARTIRFLGSTDRYFPWGAKFLMPPAFPVFFEPLGPRAVDQGGLSLLADFRRDLAVARETLDRVRPLVRRHKGHLDYLDFALEQQFVLADLVECRHLMAGKDADSRKAAAGLVVQLNGSFPKLCDRYAELWLRTDRPKGLEPNRKRFDVVRESIRSAVGDGGAALSVPPSARPGR